MDKLELFKFWAEVVMQLVLIIVPIAIAFIQKDKNKWQKVVAAAPVVVDLVGRTMRDLPGEEKKAEALKQIEAVTSIKMKGRSLNLADRMIEGHVARLKAGNVSGPA